MPAQLGVALLGEQLEVVDPGPVGGRRELARGLWVGVAADLKRDRGPERPVLIADLDPGQIERVEHQLDLPADERRVDLILIAVQ